MAQRVRTSILAELGLPTTRLASWCLMSGALPLLCGAVTATIGVLRTGAVIAVAVIVVVAYRCPRCAIGVWIGVVALVPSWWTIQVGAIVIGPATAAGIPILLGVVMAGQCRLKITFTDACLLLFIALVALATRFFGSPFFAIRDLILIWLLSYTLGRLGRPGNRTDWAIVAVVCALSGSRGESHPPAPTDPGVTVSRHRALVILTTRT